MRSLFHFPFPAQPPSQQPSHCSQKCAIARILHPCAAPQRCFPPPARSPVPGWQESHRMHPFFAECAKKAPFLATSARNACFSRSRWQHPRPMHPFPGAIGRFGIHGARILPPRALFRVEEPEITHGAKMLPAPPGLSAAAACGPAERALRPAAWAWPACRMRGPCHLACARRPRSSPPSYTRRAPPPASRPRTPPSAAPPIAVGMSADRALPAALVLPTPTHRAHRCALAGTAWAPTRANRAPAPCQPDPSPEPTESRPRANRASSTRGAACAHPRPATRRASPCRAGSAAFPVIPAKWCGDTIAHTRKLRF